MADWKGFIFRESSASLGTWSLVACAGKVKCNTEPEDLALETAPSADTVWTGVLA